MNSTVIEVDETELLSLQKESIEQLLDMLKLELQPETRDVLYAAETTIPCAYDFYLQGRGYLQRYESSDNLNAAIELFKRAIEQDSLYVLAYASLGEAYWRKYETTQNELLIEDASLQCEQAIHWIGETLKNGYSFSEIKHQPELRKLISDERFKPIAQKYGESMN